MDRNPFRRPIRLRLSLVLSPFLDILILLVILRAPADSEGRPISVKIVLL
jgi:hypothetical protein